jgi:hypothetical protein
MGKKGKGRKRKEGKEMIVSTVTNKEPNDFQFFISWERNLFQKLYGNRYGCEQQVSNLR